jgi:hypothetical protein
MSALSDVIEVQVPEDVIARGYEFMRAAGKARLEGMVLWVGRQQGYVFSVTDLIVPEQRGLSTPDGVCAIVDAPELQRLNMHLYRNSLELVAQVHTHPGRAYHSDTDDRYAIANTVGCFSLVVPNFAKRDYALHDCAVYRLNARGEWIEVDESAPPNKILVVKQ